MFGQAQNKSVESHEFRGFSTQNIRVFTPIFLSHHLKMRHSHLWVNNLPLTGMGILLRSHFRSFSFHSGIFTANGRSHWPLRIMMTSFNGSLLTLHRHFFYFCPSSFHSISLYLKQVREYMKWRDWISSVNRPMWMARLYGLISILHPHSQKESYVLLSMIHLTCVSFLRWISSFRGLSVAEIAFGMSRTTSHSSVVLMKSTRVHETISVAYFGHGTTVVFLAPLRISVLSTHFFHLFLLCPITRNFSSACYSYRNFLPLFFDILCTLNVTL